jgi:hypothetical protein
MPAIIPHARPAQGFGALTTQRKPIVGLRSLCRAQLRQEVVRNSGGTSNPRSSAQHAIEARFGTVWIVIRRGLVIMPASGPALEETMRYRDTSLPHLHINAG